MHHHAFGHFNFQELRGQTALNKCVRNQVAQITAAQIQRRHIYRNRDLRKAFVLPSSVLLASFANNPTTNLNNQTILFSDWNKHIWGHQATFRVVPPQQCLSAPYHACLHVNLRLIVKFKLLFLERDTQVPFNRIAFNRPQLQLMAEQLNVSTPFSLSSVERQISILHQGLCIPPIVREDGDTNADTGMNFSATNGARTRQRFQNPLSQRHNSFHTLNRVDNQRKFISAQSRHCIGFPGISFELLAHKT